MTENREVGKVKFFDHKKGYGFIEIINKDSKYYGGVEFFVHFSEIKCDSSFKKLIPGEIVSLRVEPKPTDKNKNICVNVKGIYDSKLLIDNDRFIYKVRPRQEDRHSDFAGQEQATTSPDQNEGFEQEQEQDSNQDPENTSS